MKIREIFYLGSEKSSNDYKAGELIKEFELGDPDNTEAFYKEYFPDWVYLLYEIGIILEIDFDAKEIFIIGVKINNEEVLLQRKVKIMSKKK